MATTQKKSKSILITGGAGFIGSNTLLYLYPRYPQYDYTVLDALTYAGDIKNIPQEIHKSKNFRFIYGDVRNAKLIDHLVSKVNNVIHYCVTNIPGAVAKTSTYALTNVTLPYAITLANLGFKEAVRSDRALFWGVNTYNGHITYQRVAEALGEKYVPLEL